MVTVGSETVVVGSVLLEQTGPRAFAQGGTAGLLEGHLGFLGLAGARSNLSFEPDHANAIHLLVELLGEIAQVWELESRLCGTVL